MTIRIRIKKKNQNKRRKQVKKEVKEDLEFKNLKEFYETETMIAGDLARSPI